MSLRRWFKEEWVDVKTGKPEKLDQFEPIKIANAVKN